MKKALITALLLLSCSTSKHVSTVKFIDDSERTGQLWVCLYMPGDESEHKELVCGEMEEFLRLLRSRNPASAPTGAPASL